MTGRPADPLAVLREALAIAWPEGDHAEPNVYTEALAALDRVEAEVARLREERDAARKQSREASEMLAASGGHPGSRSLVVSIASPRVEPREYLVGPVARMATDLTADQVIADQVKALRSRRGITQQRLADELGWKQSTIARIESGDRTISVGDLLSLCWALNVAPGFLLAGSFQSGDVPVHEGVRVAPVDMLPWVRGYEPLPGIDYRAWAENLPDREWLERFGTAEEQQAQLAAHYVQANEQITELLQQESFMERKLAAQREDIERLATRVEAAESENRRLREGLRDLESAVRVLDVMLREPAAKGLMSAEDYRAYAQGAWLGVDEAAEKARALLAEDGAARDERCDKCGLPRDAHPGRLFCPAPGGAA